MSTVIKFGTSGWRAIVADEFTLANIRLAVAGIAAFVKTQPEPHRVLVVADVRGNVAHGTAEAWRRGPPGQTESGPERCSLMAPRARQATREPLAVLRPRPCLSL